MPTALARRFKVDVSLDNSTWVNLKGINDFNNQETPTIQGADTFDTNGFNAFEKTMTGGKVTVKVLRPTSAGTFDPGQEIVRGARFQFGTAARVYVRWYDRNGAPEAYSCLALVDWNPSKTGVADLDEVTITFTADGTISPITNPYSASAVPVVLTATPSAVAATGQVQITGTGFVGTVATSGVKFGATNATSWIVVSDTLIVAVMPAGSAGSAAVTVTNAAGAGTPLPYTRGA